MKPIKSLRITSPDAFWRLARSAGEANLRRDGLMCRLVLGLIAEDKDPHPDDVAAAIREVADKLRSGGAGSDIQRAAARLLDYVERSYVSGRPRKPGRKKARSFSKDQAIAAEYFEALERGKMRRTARGDSHRGLVTEAKRYIAKKHDLSKTKVESIIKGLHPIFSDE